MENSSLVIFSIYQNVKKIIEKQTYDVPIYKKVSNVWFNKTNSFTINNCKRIFNDVENSYYTHNDLVTFLLSMSLDSSKIIGLNKVNYENIKKTLKLYTKKSLIRDKEFIKSINKEFEFDNISQYFVINDDGENIIYSLIMNKHVSPILFLQYSKKCLHVNSENNILKSEDYLRFEKLMNLIFKTIRGGL